MGALGHIPQEGAQLFLGTEVFARDETVPRDRFRDVGCPPVDGHTSRLEAVENLPGDESLERGYFPPAVIVQLRDNDFAIEI